MMTPEDKKAWARDYHKRTHNAVYKKNMRTLKGKLVRTYRNMQSRTEGIQWKKAHLYKGKFLLSREEFYKWSLENKEYLELFEKWEQNGFDRRLSPSIDRIDSDRGYEIENMRWVTFSENCKRQSYWNKIRKL